MIINPIHVASILERFRKRHVSKLRFMRTYNCNMGFDREAHLATFNSSTFDSVQSLTNFFCETLHQSVFVQIPRKYL